MGSNPIWDSDFFRVLQIFNLSCVCCFIFNRKMETEEKADKIKGGERMRKEVMGYQTFRLLLALVIIPLGVCA